MIWPNEDDDYFDNECGEHRAMRLEAERAFAFEVAHYEAEEEAELESALDEIGASRAEYEAVVVFSRVFTNMVPPHSFGDDDIPF
jgi:hypothetical protein